MPKPPTTRDITALRRIMADLRDPETGCPWDVQQSFATIAPYTVEEAYEVADALRWIERLAPRRAILTNLHMDLDYATLARLLPDGVAPAHDGLTIEFI